MSAEPLVLVRDVGHVRLLTLNRPDKLNAFDNDLYERSTEALLAAEADDAVRVVVMTGAGRAFSAGADRAPVAPTRPDAFAKFVRALGICKPMVAAVNGVAVGIGLTMLPHFDLVLVDPTARFRAPFTALGVAPEAASSVMLERSIGPQEAARLLYTSEWLSADDAVRLGLALRICEPGAVVDDALALAGAMAAASLGSLVATRTAIVRARASVVEAALRAESEVWKGLSVPKMERG